MASSIVVSSETATYSKAMIPPAVSSLCWRSSLTSSEPSSSIASRTFSATSSGSSATKSVASSDSISSTISEMRSCWSSETSFSLVTSSSSTITSEAVSASSRPKTYFSFSSDRLPRISAMSAGWLPTRILRIIRLSFSDARYSMSSRIFFKSTSSITYQFGYSTQQTRAHLILQVVFLSQN